RHLPLPNELLKIFRRGFSFATIYEIKEIPILLEVIEAPLGIWLFSSINLLISSSDETNRFGPIIGRVDGEVLRRHKFIILLHFLPTTTIGTLQPTVTDSNEVGSTQLRIP